MIAVYFDRHKFKDFRKRKELAQWELAFELEVHQYQICKIEKGTMSPSYDLIYKVTKIFNCSMEDLVKDEAKFKFPTKRL